VGEGTFGFDLTAVPLVGGASVLDLSAFDPGARRTAINCSLGANDIASTARYGPEALYNYARVRMAYSGIRNQPCPEADLLRAAVAATGGDVGFLDSIIGGVGRVLGTVVDVARAIPTIAPVVINAAQAVQATQAVLNGSSNPAPTQSVMPAAMAAAMMAASGGSATQGSAEQAAFAAACRTDPACTAAIWAALQGGNVTPSMMNGSDTTEAQLAAAGLPPALVMALRSGGQSALNALRSLVPGLAIGGATAVGLEALTGLLPSAGGAATKFPRALFLPDPRTGQQREYRYIGRPLLYSKDLTAVRRVQRLAKRAGRGRRRSSSGSATKIMMLGAGGSVSCGKCGNGSCSGC